MKDSRFEEPKTVTGARMRMRILSEEMRGIENQLSDRNRIDVETGKRLKAEKYWEWNAKAKKALWWKQAEHAYLRDWMKENGDTIKILSELVFMGLVLGAPIGESEIEEAFKASGYLRKLAEEHAEKHISG